jgi:hypothetical protein
MRLGYSQGRRSRGLVSSVSVPGEGRRFAWPYRLSPEVVLG